MFLVASVVLGAVKSGNSGLILNDYVNLHPRFHSVYLILFFSTPNFFYSHYLFIPSSSLPSLQISKNGFYFYLTSFSISLSSHIFYPIPIITKDMVLNYYTFPETKPFNKIPLYFKDFQSYMAYSGT